MYVNKQTRRKNAPVPADRGRPISAADDRG
jgi:hypothetical protein